MFVIIRTTRWDARAQLSMDDWTVMDPITGEVFADFYGPDAKRFASIACIALAQAIDSTVGFSDEDFGDLEDVEVCDCDECQ